MCSDALKRTRLVGVRVTMKYILLFSIVLSFSVKAEVHKEAQPSDNGLKFVWWPVLPEVEGWEQDRESSLSYGINAQIPNGTSFYDSETVIYARAVFKPRIPNLKTLNAFIENDKSTFLSKVPSVKIIEAEKIINDNDIEFQSYYFMPHKSGNWEQVSYSEEGEFYLVFTISSRSELGLNTHIATYKKFVTQYAKEL